MIALTVARTPLSIITLDGPWIVNLSKDVQYSNAYSPILFIVLPISTVFIFVHDENEFLPIWVTVFSLIYDGIIKFYEKNKYNINEELIDYLLKICDYEEKYKNREV